MQSKVTGATVIVFLNLLLAGCHPWQEQATIEEKKLAAEQRLDALASQQIDSAYRQIEKDCDTAREYRLPLLVDSILKVDTLTRQTAIR